MSAGMQCDSCRKFGLPHAPGWVYVVREKDVSTPMAGLMAALGGTADTSEPATLCSMACLTEWAYVQAVTEGQATGKEPQP